MSASGVRPIDPALQKLFTMMGTGEAQELIDEVFAEAGIRSLEAPDDRFKFACELMRRGGMLEVIGRAIKIQAILRGARDPEASQRRTG